MEFKVCMHIIQHTALVGVAASDCHLTLLIFINLLQ